MDPKNEFGLQKDGSVVVDEANDYSVNLARSAILWSRPVQRTIASVPWMTESDWNESFAFKYMRYESERGYVDADDPFVGEEVDKLHRKENRSQSALAKRRKREKAEVEFSTIQQGVTEVAPSGKTGEKMDVSEDEDFLDEFGNVRDNDDDPVRITSEEIDKPESPKEKRQKKTAVCRSSPKKIFTKRYQDFDGVADRPFVDAKTGIAKHCKEPRKSNLNANEQRNYLRLMTKFPKSHGYSAVTNSKDYKVFCGYRDIVRQEQAEYQEFAKSEFGLRNLDNLLGTEARRYAEARHEADLSRVWTYPKSYSMLESCPSSTNNDSMVRLVPLAINEKKPQFEMLHEGPLLELGTRLKVTKPNINHICHVRNPLRVPSKFGVVNAKWPASAAGENFSTFESNSRRLADFVRPDVVVGVDAIVAIFDNFSPKFDNDWIIPFRVEMSADGRRVVYVDSPLPSRRPLSAHEKNVVYHKAAGKCLVLHPWTQSMRRDGNVAEEDPEEVDDDNDGVYDDGVDVDLSALDTFGGQTDGFSELPQLDGGGVSDDDDDEEDERMMIVESDDGETAPLDAKQTKDVSTSKPTEAKNQGGRNSEGDLLGNLIASQMSMLNRNNDGHFVSNANRPVSKEDKSKFQPYKGQSLAFAVDGDPLKDYVQPEEGTNVAYNSWQLRPKGSKTGLRVIVKAEVDGVLNIKSRGITQVFTVSTKTETQSKFGVDVVGCKELAGEWMATLLRPGSCLLRLRVDAATHDVVDVEQKTLQDLTGYGYDIGFKPDENLGYVYTLLKGICDRNLDEGRYIMQHNELTGAFVKVMKAVDLNTCEKKVVFDLHSAFYVNRASEDFSMPIPWRPIDVNQITRRHQLHGRVPGLFSPKETGDNQRNHGRGRGRGRWKKKERGK